MPASSTVTNWVKSLLTQTLFTEEPLMSKVCRSSFCPPAPVLVNFLRPTGEEGRLETSKCPDPCLLKFINGELFCGLNPIMSSCIDSLFDLKHIDVTVLNIFHIVNPKSKSKV